MDPQSAIHNTSVAGSVSQLIADLKDGDEEALAQLHRRYWPTLVNLAQAKLRRAQGLGDEEDVAQTAFIALYQSFQRGRVPRLENRRQLLALLSHIVACKAVNQIQVETAQKRGGGAVQSISPLQVLAADRAHTPVEDAILRDCYTFYLDALPMQLRVVAELHLAGLENREIAEQLNCVERTVERKLALLRVRWRKLAKESLTSDVSRLLSGGDT